MAAASSSTTITACETALLPIFAAIPAPSGPSRSCRAASASSTGVTCRTASTAPPTSRVVVPARISATPDRMAASTSATPRGAHRSPCARMWPGPTVLVSTIADPDARCSSRTSTTRSETASVGSDSTTTSHAAASSGSPGATVAPVSAATRAARSPSTSNTDRGWAVASRCAIEAPMLPQPTSPGRSAAVIGPRSGVRGAPGGR
jgi:hypothetical protein